MANTQDPKQLADLWAFLQEIYYRFGAKSPKFFQVVNVISALCSAIAGIPYLIIERGIKLPHPFDLVASSTVSIAAGVAYVISKLTVKSPAAMPDAQLPFTTKKEA